MVRRLFSLALLGVLVTMACEVDPLTEIVVVSDTDLRVPDELDTIRITATDAQGLTQEAQASLSGNAARPVTLGLVSRQGQGTLDIVVIGTRAGDEIVRRRARVAFARGRTRAFRMDLWNRCTGLVCGADNTCGDDGCRPIDIDAAELVDWTGEPPDVRDAGVRDAGAFDAGIRDAGAFDSGADAGPFDAARPIDAPPPDVFVPECEIDTDCVDAWSCTVETCEMGRCVQQVLDSACNDAVACTSERCDVTLGCVYETHNDRCDDNVACTTDSCDRLNDCVHVQLHDTCAAGQFCDLAAGCTTAPTFTDVYTTIIQARCSPCHFTDVPRRGDLDFADQATAYASLINVTALCGAGVNTRVIPRDATRSLLWRKVAAVDLCGSRMPRGTTMPLNPAQISLIEHWIQGGALE